MQAALSLPEFPAGVEYLWRCYLRLRQRSAVGFNGADPITWREIDAFIRRAGIRLAPWEVEIIEAVDNAFLASRDDTKPPPTPDGGKVKELTSMQDGVGVKAVLGAVASRRVVVTRKKGGARG